MGDPAGLVEQAKAELAFVVQTYLPEDQVRTVMAAAEFADRAHAGITRKSGEPYILHPIAVTALLADMQMDAESLAAALLHDVIEDTEFDKQDLSTGFGPVVAELVDGVTKLKISKDKQINQAASFRKMLTATLQDPRVMVIKLADRLHNMSTLGALSPEKKHRIARETLDIFVPMGRLIGMRAVSDQLELLCLEAMDPDLFAHVTRTLHEAAPERLARERRRQQQLERGIARLGLHAEVTPQSNELLIYQDFFRRRNRLADLLKIHAFDVVLDSVSDCDRLAGWVRQQASQVEIIDQIRHPQPGGRQFLQLNLRDSDGLMQLFLQTPRMQEAARLGLALGDAVPQASRSVIQASLQNLSELIDRDCAKTTFSALLEYLHHDKIIGYTPDGDLHELPQGATLIDFAYAASLFLGNHAIGARINGERRPLTAPLISGQVVEIITDPLATPNPDWLSVVTTQKARRAIQHVLREQDVEEQRMVGRQALERALRSYDLALQDLSALDWADLLHWQQLPSREALFERMAVGDLWPQLVTARLLSHHQSTAEPDRDSLIENTLGLEVRYAQCCHPIYGDPIRAHLTRRGVVIHRRRCPNLLHERQQHPESIVTLRWRPELSGDPRFPVDLVMDRPLQDEETTELIYRVREQLGGVESLNICDDRTELSLVVRDRDHLARLIRDLRGHLGFPQISRVTHH